MRILAQKLMIFVIIPFTVLFILWGYGASMVIKDSMSSILKQYGFENSHVGSLQIRGQYAVLKDIELDNNGFSNIETLYINFNWRELISSGNINSLNIDGISLVGEFNKDGSISIAGWSPTLPSLMQSSINDISIKNLKLDVNAGKDVLRINAKGKINKDDDGSIDLQTMIWGQQHQLNIDSSWDVNIAPNGEISVDIDFNKGRINLANLKASRLNGWISADSSAGHATNLGGQFAAGTLSILELPFTNVTMTFDGNLQEYSFIAQSRVAGFNNFIVAGELNKSKEETLLNTTFETDDLPSFLSFITALHNSIEKEPYIPENYKTQLLAILGAHSDRKKIKKTIESHKFDRLEFVISGNSDDLTGKVIAKDLSKSKPVNYVISLDPHSAKQ